MSTCIFIFTRDLRIEDNTGLNYAAKNYKTIIPLFIFNDTQIGKTNKYKSERSIDFMKASLLSLNSQLQGKLNILNGISSLKNIVKKEKIQGIVINKDYTPYAKARELTLETFCKENSLMFSSIEDYLLNGSFVLNGKKEHYKKFTPFFNIIIKNKIRVPYTYPGLVNKMVKIKSTNKVDFKSNVKLHNVIDILQTKEDYIKNYTKKREIVKIDGTRISVYLKFGLISVRQVYKIVKAKKDFVRSLIWRDFYYTYYYFSPKALEQGDQYKENFKWNSNSQFLTAWKNGKTGFPIVDAGMRQMNETGYMHNRVRMVVASFLAKTLIIDWKEGERYFSNQLLDIDWIINTGNWQNVVSVAKHSQPYFRVFNPWIQSKKYDKDCEYIKKWIPELRNVPNESIHKWESSYINFPGIYIKPIVNYNETKKEYLRRR
jgi:deoxyribodipyrimidine photo-lyase